MSVKRMARQQQNEDTHDLFWGHASHSPGVKRVLLAAFQPGLAAAAIASHDERQAIRRYHLTEAPTASAFHRPRLSCHPGGRHTKILGGSGIFSL